MMALLKKMAVLGDILKQQTIKAVPFQHLGSNDAQELSFTTQKKIYHYNSSKKYLLI